MIPDIIFSIITAIVFWPSKLLIPKIFRMLIFLILMPIWLPIAYTLLVVSLPFLLFEVVWENI